jgi:hypothetical protein
MKNIFAVMFAAVLLLSLQSCPKGAVETIEDPRISEAELMDIPAFDWYTSTKRYYETDPVFISEIEAKFDADSFRFLVFLSPCSICSAKQFEAPRFVRALNDAGIGEEFYEFYSLSAFPEGEYPYMDILEIKRLPGLFVLKNDVPVYSILDTLTEVPSKSTFTIERLLSEALDK